MQGNATVTLGPAGEAKKRTHIMWHQLRMPKATVALNSSAALPIIGNSLLPVFAHFKLRAHFLNLRGLLFNLGRENLHPFLLLRNRDFSSAIVACWFSIFPCCSWTFLCSLRNSLSNIAFIESKRRVSGFLFRIVYDQIRVYV
jgi:hypothetical protein